ncbi:MAG: GDSL family lipase [Armatimonadetes bacterium]|nr:GDSL family lipase [Armatimonadota bacterium]
MLVAALLTARLANDAIVPVPRPDDWWRKRHDAVIARVKQGNSDLVFIGDSITHAFGGDPQTGESFNNRGKDSWDKFFGKYHPVNLGFSGDRTQHVLWRLDNGEMDGVQPKVVVVMIGTNNIGSNSPEQIAEGVSAILDWLRVHQRQAKIVLHAIFPRSPNPDNWQRRKVDATNLLLEPIARQKHAIYLDIGAKFLDEYGVLHPTIMPDYLHPNADGYAIWAKALKPTLDRLLGK